MERLTEKELRIGNYVEIDDWATTFLVHGIDTYGKVIGIRVMDLAGYTSIFNVNNIKPIPLTEKWLLDFGFEDKGEEREEDYSFTRFHKSGLYLERFGNEDYFICDNLDQMFGSKDINKIKHVHQLQNIYFALKSKELTLKNG